jgi:hypothetical protein
MGVSDELHIAAAFSLTERVPSSGLGGPQSQSRGFAQKKFYAEVFNKTQYDESANGVWMKNNFREFEIKRFYVFFFFPMARQPYMGLGLLVFFVEVSWSHTFETHHSR